jgi:hypothetical protein
MCGDGHPDLVFSLLLEMRCRVKVTLPRHCQLLLAQISLLDDGTDGQWLLLTHQ